MSSLLKLWEQTENGRDFWDKKATVQDLGQEAINVISRGLEIRPDRTEGNTFWDDFISVISNNSDGASKLLGVGKDVISKWTPRIRRGLEKIREENASKDKDSMVQTGTE